MKLIFTTSAIAVNFESSYQNYMLGSFVNENIFLFLNKLVKPLFTRAHSGPRTNQRNLNIEISPDLMIQIAPFSSFFALQVYVNVDETDQNSDM